MHHYLLCIGSNTYAKANIERAKKALQSYFPDIVFTHIIPSKPYGKIYKRPFFNILAVFFSFSNIEEINCILKKIEKNMGRNPDDKEKGRVIIDIDLIRKDENVLRPKDMNRSYVQDLLPFI